jgi:hypothetical protein
MDTNPAPASSPTKSRELPPPPKQIIHWQQALLWHGIGFLTIIILTWSYELFDLAHRVFGGVQRDLNLVEGLAKTGVIVLLWGASAYQVYRIVSRLSHLENFLQICAWCRKINVDNQWQSLEKRFTQQTGKRVSHGICPECARKFQAGLSLEAEG